MLTGCQKSQQEGTETMQEAEQEIVTAEEEMLVAVNVDSSVSELPFENVWLNRSKFWGGLIFQG